LWATDEHRIGLKPLLGRVWTPAGPRPHALVQQRFAWRWLVGFVHPASGRTVFHLASAVSSAVFAAELAAFAEQVGAGPTKQIVLVLDQVGWHTSTTLRVPDHVHLLFLPAYSPELQPAEHLWPLTNTALINRHFVDLDELEDPQARRCVALQRRRDLIRSATRFPWWPLRIKLSLCRRTRTACAPFRTKGPLWIHRSGRNVRFSCVWALCTRPRALSWMNPSTSSTVSACAGGVTGIRVIEHRLPITAVSHIIAEATVGSGHGHSQPPIARQQN
jgi:transposase